MKKKKINVEIGQRIHIARELKHYTQETLAEKLDLTTQYLSDAERGVTGISVNTLMNICNVLDVSSDYILFGGEISSKDLDEIITKIKKMEIEEQTIISRAIDNVIDALNYNRESKSK